MPDSQKILLIDDDATMSEMIRLMVGAFRRGTFSVTHAATYEEGLKELLTGAYTLCLLDYHLGARDGLELLREAKAQQCHTPIIILTGDSGEETDLAAMDGGAADFMKKIELNPRGLERAVGYALKMSETVGELRDLASVDELTQLPNRREFDRRLKEEWQRAGRFRRPLSLVMIDLDRFKAINDTYGHPAGDEVLRHAARLLTSQTRQMDCVARLGGDEFALLLVGTDRAGAEIVASRVRQLAATTPCRIPARNLSLEVGVSAGVATWPDDALTQGSLVASADAALYEFKRLHRTA